MPSNGMRFNATLARAVEATARFRDEIDDLWCDSVTANDGDAADRLVAVSHAIHRAFSLLDEGPVIG